MVPRGSQSGGGKFDNGKKMATGRKEGGKDRDRNMKAERDQRRRKENYRRWRWEVVRTGR